MGNIQGDGGVSVMQQPESKAYIAYAASDAVATLVLGVFQLVSGFEPVLDELRTLASVVLASVVPLMLASETSLA